MEGLRRFEFRSWPPPVALVGQRLFLHAGARRSDKVVQADIRGLIYKLSRGGDAARATGFDMERLDESITLLERFLSAPKSLPAGQILGSVLIGSPMSSIALAEMLGLRRSVLVNDSDRHEHANWGWPISDPQRIPGLPPISGQRGLWAWTDGSDRRSSSN